MRFSLTQHSRLFFFNLYNKLKKKLEQLLKSLENYLGCGKVYIRNDADSVEFIVYKLSDLVKKILPFFQEHPILGIKSNDFHD